MMFLIRSRTITWLFDDILTSVSHFFQTLSMVQIEIFASLGVLVLILVIFAVIGIFHYAKIRRSITDINKDEMGLCIIQLLYLR